MVIVDIWVTNALIMLLPLALIGLSLATMSPRVGFGTPLTLMDDSINETLERLQHIRTNIAAFRQDRV